MTPAVAVTVLDRLFNLVTPCILVGVNACEDYISSVNRASGGKVGCAFGVTPDMKSSKNTCHSS